MKTEVLEKIGGVATDAGDKPLEDIIIEKVEVIWLLKETEVF